VEHVRRVALAKLDAVHRQTTGQVVLAADTTVDLDGAILGKPAGPDDARRMLRALSGRTHAVHTALAVRSAAGTGIELVTTAVTMVAIDDAALDWYVATGEPLDKAGAYAIQGAGGAFVATIAGSPSNVVGLPLPTAVALLARHGLAR
jgi:septum formation protein